MDAKASPSAAHLERLFRENDGLVSNRQALDAGIDPHLLGRWVREGRAERVQRGLYRLADAPPLTDQLLLEVALRVPSAVFCLLTAMAYHELGTVAPSELHLAIPARGRRPRLEYPPLRVYHFTLSTYAYGIETRPVGPGLIRVYSPEKTVADLLRYRDKLGLDLALEALREYLRRRGRSIPRLLEAARVCRVEPVLRPYLEALA